jgi:hypothetical protein
MAGERGVVAEERELSSLVSSEELAQEQSPKQARENPHRQKEPRTARHPARAIERDAAARHDHVHVRMMRHRRAPGVQHSGDADLRAEPLGIGGDRQRGLSRRRKQQTVDGGFVVAGDIGDRARQCEHEVEVADRQQFGLTLGEPFLGGGAPDTWGNADCGSCCRQ